MAPGNPENGPWQCEFVFGGYHMFPSDNMFACPIGAIFRIGYVQINASLVCSFKIE